MTRSRTNIGSATLLATTMTLTLCALPANAAPSGTPHSNTSEASDVFESAPELGSSEEILSRDSRETQTILNSLPKERRRALDREISQGPDDLTYPNPEEPSDRNPNKSLADRWMFSTGLNEFISFRAWNYTRHPAFDWNTDLCTTRFMKPVAARYANYFRNACIRHDFGYRNYGRGGKLKLDPTETGRSRLDSRFYTDMHFIANAQSNPAIRSDLNIGATAFYKAVRTFGRSAF